MSFHFVVQKSLASLLTAQKKARLLARLMPTSKQAASKKEKRQTVIGNVRKGTAARMEALEKETTFSRLRHLCVWM